MYVYLDYIHRNSLYPIMGWHNNMLYVCPFLFILFYNVNRCLFFLFFFTNNLSMTPFSSFVQGCIRKLNKGLCK